MNNNPFSLMFAKKPVNYLERREIIELIINEFTSDNPSSYFYLLTGPRGSGKTVTLFDLYSRFDLMDDFIAINLNIGNNLEEELASKIYDKAKLKHLFLEKSLELNFSGVSFSLSGKEPIKNIDSILERSIKYLKSKNKKILITIDEIYNSENIRHFFHTYQNLVGLDLPVYILMTGLYENIYSIQNDKTLTFLYRAPKIWLKSLNMFEIVNSYKNILSINDDYAMKLAKLTKGYSFGYQLLGSIVFEKNYTDINNELLNEYDSKLAIYSYDKIYETLSNNELELLYSINGDNDVSIKECLQRTNMNEKTFSVYKDKLIKKGLIESVIYGRFTIALPRFYDYLYFKKKLSEM